MTKSEEMDARTAKLIKKLRDNGDCFEFTIGAGRNKTATVMMYWWSKADPKRHMQYIRYCASFRGASFAKAWITKMSAA